MRNKTPASRAGFQRPALALAVVGTNHTVAVVVGRQLNHCFTGLVESLYDKTVHARTRIDDFPTLLGFDFEQPVTFFVGPREDQIRARL